MTDLEVASTTIVWFNASTKALTKRAKKQTKELAKASKALNKQLNLK